MRTDKKIHSIGKPCKRCGKDEWWTENMDEYSNGILYHVIHHWCVTCSGGGPNSGSGNLYGRVIRFPVKDDPPPIVAEHWGFE